MGAVRMRVQTADKNITVIQHDPHDCSPLERFWTVFACKQSLICAYFYPDSDKMTFSPEKIISFLQTGTHFLLQKTLMDWSGVDYLWIFVMFLSAVWTLILTAPIHIHWWASKWCNVTFIQICSNEETNLSTSWIAWGWVNFQHIFIFCANYFFNNFLLLK